MKRHRWKSEKEMEYGTKPHVCVNCGIRKVWRGGDYQGWNYTWNEEFKTQSGEMAYSTKETFYRPDCNRELLNHKPLTP